jgi:hypothetical protein
MNLNPADSSPQAAGEQAIWHRTVAPSPAQTPRMSGKDAVDWTVSAMRMLNRGRCPALAEGVELGMKFIRREPALPGARELTVQEMIHCFANATVTDRSAKLAQILGLQVTYPRAPLLHMGLRFVAAVLWSSYAGFGIEGEEAKRQSISVKACSAAVWKLLGWNSRWFDSL